MPKEKKPKLSELALLPEPLGNAGLDRSLCELCGLWSGCESPGMRPFIPPSWTGEYLLVGEGPGEHEDEVSRKPFTGKAGQLLRQCWKEAGLSDNQIALVNAVRCRPPGNATPTMQQIRACRPFLVQVLIKLLPQYIIALGNTALRALLNVGNVSVTDYRGRIAYAPGGIGPSGRMVSLAGFYTTYHPAAVLHGMTALKDVIISDLQNVSLGGIELPERYDPDPEGPLAIDTEYDKDGKLLTFGWSSSTRANSFEFGD